MPQLHFSFAIKVEEVYEYYAMIKTGFILAEKKLLKKDKLKFQWPKNEQEVGKITKQQLEWLLSGLQINPKKYFKEINISEEKLVI